MRPNFLIIGAMKCGTTSLHRYLSGHPQVFVSEPKELCFFSGQNWERGLEWYEAQFAGTRDEIAIGEASPTYSQATVYTGTAGRIAEHLPGVKLVYLVRHPIERMRSMYVHRLASGIERRPIEEAFACDGSYLATSRYAFQIEQYLSHVDRDQLLVLTAEDLLDDRDHTFARVLGFLGVDTDLRPTELAREINRATVKRVPTALGNRIESTLAATGALHRLPRGARRSLRRLTTRPVDEGAARIPPDLEAELRSHLQDDVLRLREIAGPSVDSWGLTHG